MNAEACLFEVPQSRRLVRFSRGCGGVLSVAKIMATFVEEALSIMARIATERAEWTSGNLARRQSSDGD